MSDSAWKPYVPSASQPWDMQRAKHLHRRAALGATWDELQRSVDEGPKQSIDRLLNGSARIHGQRDGFEELSNVIGDSAAASHDPNRLKAWWLFRMLFGPDPLREKMTLLWHDHFATSNLKVRDLLLMRNQNELFRKRGMGKFGDLLHAVLRDPAMLYWLDANSNRSGQPNENLARELMELFTLGVGHYTEQDVKAVARALTGWSVKRAQVGFVESRHDRGEKTILGHTDTFDADGVTTLLLAHRSTSRRLAWRLCTLFMGEDAVHDAALEELASGLRDRQLDLGWAVKTILHSRLFFADANIGSRISSPVEFLIGAVRSLELLDSPPSTLIMAEWCGRMGQDLFYPPNVGGWQGGRDWLTSRTIVARCNFAAALTGGELRAPTEIPRLEQLLARHLPAHAQGESGHSEPRKTKSFFESLLLSKPCVDEPTDAEMSLGHVVARLLSSPQALLT